MGPKDLPEDVQRFYEHYIDSVELLHVLILLHGQKDRRWSIAGISEELRSSESSVSKRLQALVQRKLVHADSVGGGGSAQYRPHDPDTDALVDRSLGFYKAHSYRIIDLIFSKPTNAIQSIADAFRFRKDD